MDNQFLQHAGSTELLQINAHCQVSLMCLFFATYDYYSSIVHESNASAVHHRLKETQRILHAVY